jgi:DNA recombination protein RmuC
MNSLDPAVLIAAVAGALALVFLAWALMERRRAGAAEQRAWDLRERYAESEARMKLLEDQAGAQSEFLRVQATQSAGAVAEEMLKRADETFRNRELLAQQRLEAQLKPVAETLAKFEAQVTAVEKARAEETGGLKQQISLLMTASAATRDEARRLTEALKGNTGKRGRWGEQTCRNVLEMAGMAGRFDYIEQKSEADDDGRQLRPDFIVKLAGGGMFIIDAKVPIAFPDSPDGSVEQALATDLRIAASVKNHMKQLASKGYQDRFKPSPDFVAMFVPSDALLSAALDHEPELMTQAMTSRVVIVTPSTLFALCKAVAYGWRVEEQAANADKVAKLGRDLYERIAVMAEHASSLGVHIQNVVGSYNKFVGSVDSRVLPQLRKFEELKVDHEGKSLPVMKMVEVTPKSLPPIGVPSDKSARAIGGDGA